MTSTGTSFTLHIILTGLFVFVPQHDGLTILIPDFSAPSGASDGTPIPDHRALLVYSCNDLDSGCQAADRQQAALDDMAVIHQNDYNLGVRQLHGYQLSIVGNIAPQTPPVPVLPNNIADLSKIDPGSSKVDPDMLLTSIPNVSRDLLVARMKITNFKLAGEDIALPDVNNASGTVMFDFSPLNRTPVPNQDEQRQLFHHIDVSMTIKGCSVSLRLDDFDGHPVATIPLYSTDCDNPNQPVVVNLYNQTRCTWSGSPPRCAEAAAALHRGVHHFEAYYELSKQRPPARRRKVPQIYLCGGKLCSPSFDGLDRPICPTVQMVP